MEHIRHTTHIKKSLSSITYIKFQIIYLNKQANK